MSYGAGCRLSFARILGSPLPCERVGPIGVSRGIAVPKVSIGLVVPRKSELPAGLGVEWSGAARPALFLQGVELPYLCASLP